MTTIRFLALLNLINCTVLQFQWEICVSALKIVLIAFIYSRLCPINVPREQFIKFKRDRNLIVAIVSKSHSTIYMSRGTAVHSPSEDSDQPKHTRSLITFWVAQGTKACSSGQLKLWSACTLLFAGRAWNLLGKGVFRLRCFNENYKRQTHKSSKLSRHQYGHMHVATTVWFVQIYAKMTKSA